MARRHTKASILRLARRRNAAELQQLYAAIRERWIVTRFFEGASMENLAVRVSETFTLRDVEHIIREGSDWK